MSTQRREVSSRKVVGFQKLARTLVRWGMTPNQISLLSTVFAIIAGLSLAFCLQPDLTLGTKKGLLVLAVLCIQLRLICNLIDGLMAIEGGLKTKAGELFNDVPDRVSDVVIILGVGFAAQSVAAPGAFWLIHLTWLCALLAVLTAYVRTLGASMTGQQDFAGPMAKQHRMFVITLACFGAALELIGEWSLGYSFLAAILIVGVGSLLTCINRLWRIYRYLNA